MDQQMSGPRYDGREWPDHGAEFEVPDWEGAELCAGGMAHPKAEERKAETATPPKDPKVEERKAEPEPEPKAEPKPEPKAEAEAEPPKRGPGRPPGSTNKPK